MEFKSKRRALLITGFMCASCQASAGGSAGPVSARMPSACTELSPAVSAKVADAARRNAAALEEAIKARGLHRVALPTRWLPSPTKNPQFGDAIVTDDERDRPPQEDGLSMLGEPAPRSKGPPPELLADSSGGLYVLSPKPERGDVEEILVCGCYPDGGADQSMREFGAYGVELPPGASVKGSVTIAYKPSIVTLSYDNMRDGQPCEPAS